MIIRVQKIISEIRVIRLNPLFQKIHVINVICGR